MLDGVDPRADGHLGPRGAVGVGRRLLAEAVGLVHEGVHLGLGELGRVHRVGEGEDASRGADLDEVRPVLELHPHRVAELVGPARDPFGDAGLVAEEVVGEARVVAVSPPGAQGIAGHEHSGAGDDAGIDGVAQAHVDVVAGAHVAHGGEAGHEGLACVVSRANGLLGDGPPQVVEGRLVPVVPQLAGEMHVGVDEARKQRSVAEIDDRRAGRRCQLRIPPPRWSRPRRRRRRSRPCSFHRRAGRP